MRVLERILAAAKGEEVDKVPVALVAYSQVLKSVHGVNEYEYLHSLDLQLEAKVEFIKMFPEVWNPLIGMPECGHGWAIPVAFGAKLVWFEDRPPFIEGYPIKEPEDVDRIIEAGMPDPREVGVSKVFLEGLRYFTKRFPRDLMEEYGYVEGIMDPEILVEGAALAMGYDKFLIWMRKYPETVHKWLRFATEFHIRYCEAIEEVIGKPRIFFLPDHMASMVSKKYFEEFVLPYLNKLFNRYPKALKIWHNEGCVKHMLDAIDKLKADVWQCGPGDDPVRVKEETHLAAWGNIHPPWIVGATPSQVEEECKKLILRAAPGGRFWLGTGGGMAPGTSPWHIRAFIRAVEKYGVYPIGEG